MSTTSAVLPAPIDVGPSVPHTKRFLERWVADTRFREVLDRDPAEAVRQFGLLADPELLRPLYDISQAEIAGRDDAPEEVRDYRRFIDWKLRYRQETRRLGAPAHPAFQAWRGRQMMRSLWEVGLQRFEGLVHAPLTFELSKGCTVKCWFCGVGALPFGGNFPYDAENARLWRGVLQAAREVTGEAGATGFCYWATDPLDNPDYERFICDFDEIMGRFPQTTTAQPMKDVARTRRLLALSQQRSGAVERFSVLSRGVFDRILAEFTAEELLNVELIPQFNDAASPKAVAGAGRERLMQRAARANAPPEADFEDGGTIACVTGFLFNMVERKVMLISPCSANAKWPLGYIVFDEFVFTDAGDLRARLKNTIERRMPLSVTSGMRIAFAHPLQFLPTENGFHLKTRHFTLNFDDLTESRELGARIAAANASASEIAIARYHEAGIPTYVTYRDLTRLLERGVLSEEPSP